MQERIEILAPAGGFEALTAGVANGADAVYLGGNLFNARQFAANFSNEKLKKAIEYCHGHNVKVYITVNTLLLNHELEEAAEYLYFLYSIGVDAVIIQDLGLLFFIKEVIPGLTVHASTQMTIHNEYGANYLWNKGVERVVLARELSINDIKAIQDNSPIELEIFVHGALCISYSGQCLFSSMVGGRSGNRGRCAQPCRLPYKLVETKDGRVTKEWTSPGEYLLSPRDLNTIQILPELIQAGVDSFKFEGRMKRPEYVATVIRIYRQALDRYYNDTKNYHVDPEDLVALEQIFNRDFTQAYLFKEKPGADLMSFTRPNNRGIFLGRVVDFEKGRAIVKLETDLSLGDGIQAWVSVGGRKGEIVKNILLNGTNVEKAAKGSLVHMELPRGIKKGDRIFKTYDQRLMEKAQSTYTEGPKIPRVRLDLAVEGEIDKPLKIQAVDELGNKITVYSEINCQKAIKHSLDQEILAKQLGRLGETNYTLGELTIDLHGELMLPISELNKIRRKITTELEEETNKNNNKPKITSEEFIKSKKHFFRHAKNNIHSYQKNKINLNIKVGDYEAFIEAFKERVDNIYIPLIPLKNKRFSLEQVKDAIIEGKKDNIKIIPFFPRIIHSSKIQDIALIIKELKETNPDGLMVGNLGLIQFIKDYAPEIPIYCDYSLNITNWSTAKFLLRDKAINLCLSPELNFTQLASFPLDILQASECLVHGQIPLIVSKYCPTSAISGCAKCKNKGIALKDRKDYIFPLEMDAHCTMHLYNANVLSVIDNLNRFIDMGIGGIRLEMERESGKLVEKVIKYYQEGLFNGQDKKRTDELLELIKNTYPGGITKGHYFRGVE